jgi:peptidoglycan/xylan/chitin deacetylase (PgdA/CDA1 family)
MKYRKIILTAFCILHSAFYIANAQPAHIIITAGQSNTDGRVNNKLLPDYIKALATDTVDFKEGAYRFCKISQNRRDGKFISYFPQGRITDGLWTYDAVTYYLLEQALQEDFYVIKYAVGGTSIQYPNDSAKGCYRSANPEWPAKTASVENKGKSLLLSFTGGIDAAIDNTLSKLENGYTIDAFLWHQGESDDHYAGRYYENLKTVIAYVRAHLTEKTGKDYSRLPFIFGSIPTANRHFKVEIDEAMRRIAQEDANAYPVDMSEGELQRDRTHFNEKAAEYPGKEMYKVLNKVLSLKTYNFHIAKYKGDKTAAISYTFDDGLAEHFSLVFPAFEKLGFKGTFWINGNTIEQWETNPKPLQEAGKARMTWKQLRKMARAGHEISSHGWAHRNVTKLSSEELRYELQHNDTVIFQKTGVFPRTFCYPGNAENDSVVAVVERDRIASRTKQFSVGGKSTAESLDNRVAELLVNRDWGVTMTHGITYGYDHLRNAEILWEHLQKVKAQEDKIWVGTFAEVAAYVKERDAVKYDITKSEKGFTITPALSLDKTLFAEPLTGVIEQENIKKIAVRQGKKKLKTQILSGGKVLFEFNPYGEKIEIEINQ